MATMLTTSPSPRLTPSAHQGDSVSGFLSPSLRRGDNLSRLANGKSASPIVKPHPTHVSAYPLTSSSQPHTTLQQAQSSPVQARPISSPSAARSQCTSPPETRSHQPSVRSISTQTSSSPIHTTSLPSRSVVMVDAQTQYSPPLHTSHQYQPIFPSEQDRTQPDQSNLAQTPASSLADLHLNKSQSNIIPDISTPLDSARVPISNKRPYDPVADAAMSAATPGLATSVDVVGKEQAQEQDNSGRSYQTPQSSFKRDHSTTISDTSSRQNGTDHDVSNPAKPTDLSTTPSKKHRPADPEVKIMPLKYELCDTRDLVILISSMLMELIRYNDTIPISSASDTSGQSSSNLTRFHSRAPPGISVIDYLQRLTTYATLPPPILLSMVYYIDRLASFYPAFTISSLTVHRFLITAATVASKGLSDSFWTNKTYAKVGGVSIKELALLELEFLVRVQWRIVPRPETLLDYYKSLVGRSRGYRLEGDDAMSAEEEERAGTDGDTED